MRTAATAPRRSVTTRSRRSVGAVARSLTIAATSVVVLALAAVPASAAEGLGDRKPWALSPLELFVLFIGIPAAVFAIVAVLVYGFSRNDEPRLREGQSWWTEPDYNTRESIGVQDPSATTPSAARTTDGGGAGAGW